MSQGSAVLRVLWRTLRFSAVLVAHIGRDWTGLADGEGQQHRDRVALDPAGGANRRSVGAALRSGGRRGRSCENIATGKRIELLRRFGEGDDPRAGSRVNTPPRSKPATSAWLRPSNS